MSHSRRAVIDVGTNSVKLLVADVGGGVVTPVVEQSHQTRLGQGFYQTRQLQPDAIARTADAVADFVDAARTLGAARLRVIATSASREAGNAADLATAIERAAGLPPEIISGAQEAEWAYLGALTNLALADGPLLLLDVGGGSTEWILGRDRHVEFRESFPLGTVRLLEQFPPGDPPAPEELSRCRDWVKEFLRREVSPKLAPLLRRGTGLPRLVGTGGTATLLGTMAARLDHFDREQIEAVCLSAGEVSRRVEQLWRLPLVARRQVPGLPANRADVILMGVVIFEAILACHGFSDLRLSTRGLRFGALLAD